MINARKFNLMDTIGELRNLFIRQIEGKGLQL